MCAKPSKQRRSAIVVDCKASVEASKRRLVCSYYHLPGSFCCCSCSKTYIAMHSGAKREKFVQLCETAREHTRFEIIFCLVSYYTKLIFNGIYFTIFLTDPDGHITTERSPQKSVFVMKLTLSLPLHRHIWQQNMYRIQMDIRRNRRCQTSINELLFFFKDFLQLLMQNTHCSSLHFSAARRVG